MAFYFVGMEKRCNFVNNMNDVEKTNINNDIPI